MADEEFPPELREIEAALAARPAPDAEGAVRARVLSAVRRELAAKARGEERSWWRFAAAAAAAVLLWLNFSASAVNDTGFGLRAEANGWDEQAALVEVRALVPDCSETEARRYVLLLRARMHLVAAPALRHAPPAAGEEL